MMKLGSLFDGIGGFPYSAQRHGITPVWASEIEPSCVSITKRHFPNMRHLGDITHINGAEIEPVDIITFGSPCQDLSVAGKRAGLDGARSGLFGEAIRIIDEMRSKTNAKYPSFAIWENVPGALSSSNGLDFKAVLQSFAGCEIPMPDSGKWANAGMVRGGRCDIAWRILDAQYWGVPQRRRRIFLVADFRGQRAAEVLFKPESLRRDYQTRGEARQETAGSAGNGVESTDCGVNIFGETGIGYWQNGAQCLRAEGENRPSRPGHVVFDCRGNGVKDANLIYPAVARALKAKGNLDHREDGDTLLCVSTGQGNAEICEDVSPTLNCNHEQPYVAGSVVRRLTPKEAERLQGFPDNWTAYGHDDKPISDTKRYAAIGNSVAIPCVDYIMSGIIDEIKLNIKRTSI